MKNNKNVIIGILLILVCIMTISYALLSQTLTINGRGSTNFAWKVEITNIQSIDVVGDAVNKVEPTYTATTANFSVGFTQPGDSITYDITVTNKGTLDAVIESIKVVKGSNPAVKYTISGLNNGDIITKNNGTNTLTLKIEYDANLVTQPTNITSDIKVILNYQQNLGQTIGYGEYAIGDIVNFSGSKWIVIKDSDNDEDYVTAIKEDILTSDDLGPNYKCSMLCENYHVSNHEYGCTEAGQAANNPYYDDQMAFYWSDDCHYRGIYGTTIYSDYKSNGCFSQKSYNKSKVKEFLEQIYINTLDITSLKEVNGYKIRLITLEELQNNLQCNIRANSSFFDEGSCTKSPYFSWIQLSKSYWTMNTNSYTSTYVWYVGNGNLVYYGDLYHSNAVRPVINLLKSAAIKE